MEKMSENRQLRFFDSSYGVYMEIEQNVSKEGFGQLVEMEMRKDGTIIAKTETIKNNSLVENFLIEINLDNEISQIPIESKEIEKFCVGDNSIFTTTPYSEGGEGLYEIDIKNDEIQKIKDFQGRKFDLFGDEIFIKDDIFFAIVDLKSTKKGEKNKSGILYKKLGHEAVFLSSDDGEMGFYDMGLDENTNVLSGIAIDGDDNEKIFDIKEDENGEYYLDYRHEGLRNETDNKMLNNGSLLKEESENDSDFVNFYIDKTCSDGENKKVLTIEGTNSVKVFRLKGGTFAVEKQYSVQNKLVSEIYLVKEDGDVEIIKEIKLVPK